MSTSIQNISVGSRGADGKVSALKFDTPISAGTPDGMEVLMRSACLMVAEAAFRLFKAAAVVKHANAVELSALWHGYVLNVSTAANLAADQMVKELRAAVQAAADKLTPIDTRTVSHVPLRAIFEEQGCTRSVALLDSLNAASYTCHVFRNWHALAHDFVVTPDATLAGLVDQLQIQTTENPNELLVRFAFMQPVTSAPALKQCLTRQLDAVDVSSVSTRVACTNPVEWVQAEERRFSSAIDNCAASIAEKGPSLRLILISGPSASGKTTFAHRLSLALRALGRSPCVLSVDDYYRDASEPSYPKTSEGKPNHELVECLRLDKFAEDMAALTAGKEVETPIFDMAVSKPKARGRTIQLAARGGILIMEGIFALNPKVTERLDPDSIFKIFVVPLPVGNIDELTFVSNQTLREIRRIVRDFRGRGRDAAASIARRATVRTGEETSIFPSMAHADLVFNSAMGHELAVLHSYCMTLLRSVKPSDPTHGPAQRIANLFAILASVSEANVPPESLLREFIGGTIFEEAESQDAASDSALGHRPAGSDSGKSLAQQRRPAECFGGFGRFNIRAARQYEDDGAATPKTVWDALLLADFSADTPDVVQALSRCGSLVDSTFIGLPDGHSGSTGSPVPAQSPLCAGSPVAPLASYQLPSASGAAAFGPSAPVIAAIVNGELKSLTADWARNRGAARIDPVFVGSRLGLQVERATLAMVVHAAAHRVKPDAVSAAIHGFGLEGSCLASAYYLELLNDPSDFESTVEVDADLLKAISAEVGRLIAARLPIEEVEVTHTEAHAALAAQGNILSCRLLETCNVPTVRMIQIDGFVALAKQPLAPHTGFVRKYSLIKPTGVALPGFALCFPTAECPNEARPPKLHERVLAEIVSRRTTFLTSHRVACIGDMNRAIANGGGAAQERLAVAIDGMQVAGVVSRVRKEGIRVVFVAGASSAGKSWFADELQRHLRGAGIVNERLCTDAFYRDVVDPEYPRTPRGQGLDYESVKALRLQELGEALNALVSGRDVIEPVFDLGVGRRKVEVEGRRVHGLGPSGVLVLEGLFALAPEIAALVAKGTPKLGVMIAPLTVASLDEQRFVSGQVLRVLRRIVRDAAERGRDASTTLSWWDNVTRGEASHAVPHLFEADVVVSATSPLEIHQLAAQATALLLQVPPSRAHEYFEARQLLGLLSWAHAFHA